MGLEIRSRCGRFDKDGYRFMSDIRIDEITKEIENIKIELVEIKTMLKSQIALQEKECFFHKTELNNIRKVIEGNGKKGLKDRLEELEKFEVRVVSFATIIFSVINFIFLKLFK